MNPEEPFVFYRAVVCVKFQKNVEYAGHSRNQKEDHSGSKEVFLLQFPADFSIQHKNHEHGKKQDAGNKNLGQQFFKNDKKKKNDDPQVYIPESDLFHDRKYSIVIFFHQRKNQGHGDQGYWKRKSQEKGIQLQFGHGDDLEVFVIQNNQTGHDESHGKA
jgi:hypothetical protein